MRNAVLSICLSFALCNGAFAKDTGSAQTKTQDASTVIPFSVDTMQYVEGNVLATFYHEIGHALIDQLSLPVFAREEDAADSFALVLTEILHDRRRAEQITWASADQYVQLERQSRGYGPDFSDNHSPDMVRFYNLICLYYGGDVYNRDDFAEDNGLPDDRAETCEEERDLANYSWGKVLSDIERSKGARDWIFIGEVDDTDSEYVRAAQLVLRKSVADLNKRFSPNFRLQVDLTDCDEDNAFYEPNNVKVIMCNEYVPPLTRRTD